MLKLCNEKNSDGRGENPFTMDCHDSAIRKKMSKLQNSICIHVRLTFHNLSMICEQGKIEENCGKFVNCAVPTTVWSLIRCKMKYSCMWSCIVPLCIQLVVFVSRIVFSWPLKSKIYWYQDFVCVFKSWLTQIFNCGNF